ncbi:type II secretion system F family protein [Usitatibacter palustris]|uniref:Type II secretion system protein F n=1 Tax=Usitatibacter palustris TaxID=2732487 RepID=A0A6M4H249_9PROT|nr:type II secretion system F family protein [Usitatibacter palustris]QJR13611.1 Type II secretion system protein F [Usitatibacter palustris]
MAAVAKKDTGKDVKLYNFAWSGKDKTGKAIKGELRAAGDHVVLATLRRQGIQSISVKKLSQRSGKKITDKDITIFTRQLAVMMKAGVPLLQAFDIVGKGHANPSVGKLLMDVKTEVETGSSLGQAFRKYPVYFDELFCNLVAAGEAAGILDAILDRLATYKEKILAIKSKIKGALFYPIAVIVVGFVVVAVIMIFVIPIFKDLFKSFGADLPAPTQIVLNISEFFTAYWMYMLGIIVGGTWSFLYTYKRSKAMQRGMDRLLLRLPVFGDVIRKASIARWCRTLSTMFAAGVPLVESLDSVAGAAGNYVYYEATKRIQQEVSSGTSLTVAMQNQNVFPAMVMQMSAIGEESGALDSMLGKVADFFEQEVDDSVDALASLMEPALMVVLGGLIGGLVVAMYLPIFKLGGAV